MKDLEKLSDDELLREFVQHGHANHQMRQLSAAVFASPKAYHEMTDALRDVMVAARDQILDRMANFSPSHEWNGVGPKRDCLLRIEWLAGGDEWLSFEWKEQDEESEHYSNDSSTLSIWCHDGETFTPNENFTITHWAEIPEVSG